LVHKTHWRINTLPFILLFYEEFIYFLKICNRTRVVEEEHTPKSQANTTKPTHVGYKLGAQTPKEGHKVGVAIGFEFLNRCIFYF